MSDVQRLQRQLNALWVNLTPYLAEQICDDARTYGVGAVRIEGDMAARVDPFDLWIEPFLDEE